MEKKVLGEIFLEFYFFLNIFFRIINFLCNHYFSQDYYFSANLGFKNKNPKTPGIIFSHIFLMGANPIPSNYKIMYMVIKWN